MTNGNGGKGQKMKYIPNSFQIANAVVDDFLCRMSGSAWKCYGIIVRKTTGWQKEMDYIPVAQFKTLAGIKKDDTVTDALKELEELGLIISIKRQGQVTGYRLNMPAPPPENGGTTTPENGVYPKNGATPENGGYPPPENGGTTTPENGGSSKHTTKHTNTKHNIHASAAADAPTPAGHAETEKRAGAAKPNPANVATWKAYAAAYRDRYGVLPAANAKTRGQAANLVRMVGADLAPGLAAYYLTHNGGFFVQCRHDFGLLLKSYQQILTDMQRGEQMTQTKARQTEKTQTAVETHKGALAILQAKGLA